FTWASNQKEDKSPVYEYEEKKGFRQDISRFDDIEISLDQVKPIAAKLYQEIKTALESKSIEDIGISRDKLNHMMESTFKIDDFDEKVFEADSYTVEVLSTIDELKYVLGKKTILAYNPSGEKIFRAGPEMQDNGKMTLSLGIETICIGKINGKWQLIFF
ncbi:MAG: hypothetical protein HRT88_23935, partial [Lentisphaeraceae bacterium]|nr:hypothetical protein [Lentisphaeraceae bacterium]